MDQAKNFAKATVDESFVEADTVLTVASGQGARFPTAPFNATLYNVTDYPDPSDDPSVEIVRVTGISTDDLTVTRAQEGTAARASVLGKTFILVAGLTAKVINDDLVHNLTSESNVPVVNSDGDLESSNIVSDIAGSGVVNLIIGGAGWQANTSHVSLLGDVSGENNGTHVEVNDATQRVTITRQPLMPNLPTSNPAIAGALWNDGGTVKVSAG